ncbi:MAG: hypothetical protein JWP37_1861 [Mucilaginibacter sp.]|nr:hypothetical protein [Mucilaginibacter sp.]
MVNPVILNIDLPDGSKRNLIIEPVLERSADGIKNTGIYKLYKSAIDNQSTLFTEKQEIDEINNDIPDEINPDYLGNITIDNHGKWIYKGDLLSHNEQRQLAEYIQNHK